MNYRRIALQTAVLTVCATILAGCGEQQTQPPETSTTEISEAETVHISEDTAAKPSTGQMKDGVTDPATEQPEDSEAELPESETEQTAPEQTISSVPALPAAGCALSDFVLEGWGLIDSVELDYNEDGITDYVGVQELLPKEGDSLSGFRVLFGIVSDGPGQYRLDFQDENLIRTREEGGMFDPYEPLTAEGASFTTHAFGGSAWKWSEAYTYTYRDGTWYLTCSEVDECAYGPYTVSYTKNDWESGIRTRKKRSSEFSDMEQHWGEHEGLEDDGVYDLEYEMRLDEPLTIYQAGKRWWLAPDRVTDWEVREIVLAEGIELSQEMVKMPDESYLHEYCDEDCVLYTFTNIVQDAEWDYYLAMYRWQDKSVTVLADGAAIDGKELYRDKIYYSEAVIEHVAYQSEEHGETHIKEEDCVIGWRLNRINPDGTGKETIFEYLYPGTDQELLLSRPPYTGLMITDISGNEIVVEVYIGSDEPHPVYRMDTDGGNLRQIGQIPRE